MDNQLLALKQKMGMLGAGTTTNKAIGAGQADEEVHAEIDRPGRSSQ